MQVFAPWEYCLAARVHHIGIPWAEKGMGWTITSSAGANDQNLGMVMVMFRGVLSRQVWSVRRTVAVVGGPVDFPYPGLLRWIFAQALLTNQYDSLAKQDDLINFANFREQVNYQASASADSKKCIFTYPRAYTLLVVYIWMIYFCTSWLSHFRKCWILFWKQNWFE